MRGLAAALLIMPVLAWLGGFAWFVRAAIPPEAERAQAVGETAARADGIVVLTGGADRILAGVALLRAGRARVMLISGVGHGADLPALLRGTGIDPAPLAPSLMQRISLGRAATSTAGNAAETSDWVRAQGLGSLLVVTASYHMPRALIELGRSLPGVTLVPIPVLPPALRRAGSLSTLRLLAGEYTKWLAAEIGLARLAPA
jgi:uncharacterized SAM-binding protein YcdF (DUF218 family)